MSSRPVVTNHLYDAIRLIIQGARKGAYTAANSAMVRAYWHIGQLIVEDEQKGRSGQSMERICSTKLGED
jgi:Protein of unknown function (DUF1016).